jgi:hypothetical protein
MPNGCRPRRIHPIAEKETAMPTMSFADWFCLCEGRANFQIRPDRDHSFMFGNVKWREDILRELQRSLLLNNPVRIVWWGDYGIGKTQRLRYMEYVINTKFAEQKPSFYPVVVTTRDLQDKSGFEQLHYELVNRLKFDEMRKATLSYKKKLLLEQPGPIPFEQLTTSEDVHNAFHILGGDNERFAPAAWRFLAGQDVKNAMQVANVHKAYLDSSVEFADVLKIFATIIEIEWGKQLFYLIDQFEALSKITNKNAEARWVETLRAVLDVPNLSIVLAIGASRVDGIPQVVSAAEIVRRFTLDKYIQMGAYETKEAESFVEDLLKNLIDPAKRDARAKSGNWTATVPGYQPRFYPFTEKAFRKFCRYFGEQPKIGKPAEIIPKLDFLAAEAYMQQKSLIDEDFLVAQGINA